VSELCDRAAMRLCAACCMVLLGPGLAANRASAQDSPPAAEKLIRSAAAAYTEQVARGWKYTYREDEEEFLVDKKRQRAPSPRKTYEIIMLEGEPYRKLLLVNGQPLDEPAQKKVDEDLEKARKERVQKSPRIVTKSFQCDLAGIEQVERIFDSRVTGEETVLGRKSWRVESVPKRGFHPATREERQTASTHRVTWIDEQDGVELKNLSTFFRAADNFQAGTQLEQEFGKVGADWLPATTVLRFDVTIGVMQHAYGETHIRDYDYKRFTVESRIVQP